MFKRVKLRLLVLVLSIIILQMTLVPFISFNSIGPDLFILLFILISIKYPIRYSFYSALIFGMIRELFSSQYFGVELVPFLIAGSVLPLLMNKFNLENKIIKFCTLFIFSCLIMSLNIIAIALAEQSVEVFNAFFIKTISSSLYTAIASIIFSSYIDIFVPKQSIQYELF